MRQLCRRDGIAGRIFLAWTPPLIPPALSPQTSVLARQTPRAHLLPKAAALLGRSPGPSEKVRVPPMREGQFYANSVLLVWRSSRRTITRHLVARLPTTSVASTSITLRDGGGAAFRFRCAHNIRGSPRSRGRSPEPVDVRRRAAPAVEHETLFVFFSHRHTT